MTVRHEIPYIEYVGNGEATDFPFSWSSGDPGDNYVLFNTELQIEGILYELEEYTAEHGGIMRFNEPPTTEDRIVVFRDTPVTQEVDYEEGKPFPAETHERQMDKDTRILQEIISAGKSVGGVLDLSADQQPEYVDILNSAGTDARIVPWTTDGLTSGVAMGEVIPDGGTLPQDTAPTDKHDGYIWWGLGTPAAAGGDANISMYTAGVLIESTRIAPSVPRCELSYTAVDGTVGWGYDDTLPLETPEWVEQQAFVSPIVLPNTYVIMMELVSGTVPDGTAVDVWLDAAYNTEWYLPLGEFYGILHVAPDAGGQTPDETYKISRNVTMRSVQN